MTSCAFRSRKDRGLEYRGSESNLSSVNLSRRRLESSLLKMVEGEVLSDIRRRWGVMARALSLSSPGTDSQVKYRVIRYSDYLRAIFYHTSNIYSLNIDAVHFNAELADRLRRAASRLLAPIAETNRVSIDPRQAGKATASVLLISRRAEGESCLKEAAPFFPFFLITREPFPTNVRQCSSSRATVITLALLAKRLI